MVGIAGVPGVTVEAFVEAGNTEPCPELVPVEVALLIAVCIDSKMACCCCVETWLRAGVVVEEELLPPF